MAQRNARWLGLPHASGDDISLRKPPLWNPSAAANWSILFTPIFGAYLHALNWRALGRPDKAKVNVVWLWATVALLAISLFAQSLNGTNAATRFGGFVLLVGWYFTQGRPQAKYVDRAFPEGYAKKSWMRPLACGAGALAGYVALWILFAFIASDRDFGALLKFDHGDVYYTAAVNKADAQRLADYLFKEGYFENGPATVQLNKAGRIYEVRLAVKTGIDQDQQYTTALKQFAAEISRDVFVSMPVEVHVCDEKLNTLRVIVPFDGPASFGTLLMFNNAELYYTTLVTEDEAQSLGKYLVNQGIFNGEPRTAQLTKSGRTYEVRFVTKKGIEQDPQYIDLLKQSAVEISRNVFGSAPVDIHMCDENLATVRRDRPIAR